MADVAEAHDRDALGSLSFLACIGDEVTRETVNRVVSHLGTLEAKVRAGDLASARKAIDPKVPPDLMLLDISGSADPVAALALGAPPPLTLLLVDVRPAVADGHLAGPDEDTIAREAAAQSRRLYARAR